MPGFSDLPVNTTISPTFLGLPLSGPPPTDLQKWEFWWQYYEAIQEKFQPFGCGAVFPQGNVIWGGGTIASIDDHSANDPPELVFHMTGVTWSLPAGFSGTRWKGYHSSDPDLCYLPSDYDILTVSDSTDPYTLIRGAIKSNTYNSGDNTGTITVDSTPWVNAVAAKFIPSIASLVGKVYLITKTVTGLHYWDRRPLKPNQREVYKGTVLNSHYDAATGKGYIEQQTEDYNDDPYDKPTPDPVAWQKDVWKNKEILFFDSNGLLRRKTISGNGKQRIIFGAVVVKVTVTGSPSGGTFTLSVDGATTTPLAYNASNAAVQAAITALATVGTGNATVTGAAGGPWTITFAAAVGAVETTLGANNLTGGSSPNVTITDPSGGLSLSGKYIIVEVNDKGIPGREPDPTFAFYRGLTNNFYSHDVNDTLNGAKKPAPIGEWQDLNSDNECQEYPHLCFDIDCQIELTNVCECARAGDFLAPKFYCSWRQLQEVALGLLPNYVDRFNTYDTRGGLRHFTPATWALGYQTDSTINTNGANLHAWQTTIAVDGTTHIGTVGSTNAAPYYPINVYWTLEDDKNVIVSDGTASMASDGKLSGSFTGFDGYTITLWFGFSKFYRRRHNYVYPKTQIVPDCGCLDDDCLVEGCIDPPAITPNGQIKTPTGVTLTAKPTGGTLNYGTTYGYRVSALNGSGETLASATLTVKAAYCPTLPPTCPSGTISCDNTGTVVCSDGSTPTCTSGSPVCQSGTETCTAKTCSTGNTYLVVVAWTPVVGAAGYKIYGRDGGSEQFIGSTDGLTYTYTDDGSITPSGALPVSNTTHNDCFGAATWIKRGVSTNYLKRDAFGFASETGPAFAAGEISAYMGDAFHNPFDGQGGVRSTLTLDAQYWDYFFRGTRRKQYEDQRALDRTGEILDGGTYWFKSNKHWWTDAIAGVNNGHTRIQGGVATGGTSSSLTDSTYNVGQKSCWFHPLRFIGLGGVYGGFILQVYKGGMPQGYTAAIDGTVTYAEPSTSGSGSVTTGAPTISSVRPSMPAGDSVDRTFVVVGNNFHPDCKITISDDDNSVTYSVVPTSITAGVVVMTFAFNSGGNWSVTATNLVGGASAAFDFTVQDAYRVPITSGSGGTLSFTGVPGLTVAASDGYLIYEPVGYELNKWENRSVTVTKLDGTQTTIYAITNSDDGFVYVPVQTFAFEAGMSFAINEFDYASKLKFATVAPTDGRQYVKIATGKYWIDPAGDADNRSGSNVPFLHDLKANLETKVADYGFFMAADDIGPHIFNELFYLIRSMQWTERGVGGFTKSADPEVPEDWLGAPITAPGAAYKNGDTGISSGSAEPIPPDCDTLCETAADAMAVIEYVLQPGNFYCNGIDYSDWRTTSGTGSLGALPFTNTLLGNQQGYDVFGNPVTADTGVGVSLTAEAGYTSVKAGCVGLSATVEFMAYSIIPGGTFGDLDLGPEPGDHNAGGCEPDVYTYNDFGTGLVWRYWTKWSTKTGTGDVEVVSDQLGNVAEPPIPALVSPCQPCPSFLCGATNREGYVVTRVTSLHKWNMVYV